MQKAIKPDQASHLPLHDAEIYFWHIKQESDGTTLISLQLEINDDLCPNENNKVSVALKGKGSLIFNKCWFFKSEYFFIIKNRDTIYDLKLITDSSYLLELKGMGISQQVFHFQIKFNSGARCEIVSEELWWEKL